MVCAAVLPQDHFVAFLIFQMSSLVSVFNDLVLWVYQNWGVSLRLFASALSQWLSLLSFLVTTLDICKNSFLHI
jgi:hypothetical protein